MIRCRFVLNETGGEQKLCVTPAESCLGTRLKAFTLVVPRKFEKSKISTIPSSSIASRHGWTSQVSFAVFWLLQHVDEMASSSQHKHSKRGMKKMLTAHKTVFKTFTNILTYVISLLLQSSILLLIVMAEIV